MERCARGRGDEPGAPVGMEETALGEEAGLGRRRALGRGPDERLQRLISAVVDIGIGADIEVALALVLEGREAGMLAKDVGDALPGEFLAMAQAARDLGDDPPVLARLAGRRQERTLA